MTETVVTACLPFKGGGVPLSVFPKDTTSKLAGIFRSESDSIQFHFQLNSLHSSLAFTTEKEKNGQLPFLDVLIEKTHQISYINLQKTHIYWTIYSLEFV